MDLRAACEFFGDAEVKLDEFELKSKGEFEKFGSVIVYKYLMLRSESGFYIVGLKVLLRVVMRDLTAAEAKDVET